MKAIIGLGNPGTTYANNRHNAGYMLLDCLSSRWGVNNWFSRCQALALQLSVEGEPVLLAKPRTFMNNSGHAVKCLLKAYQIGTEDMLLVYDDLDLEVGQLRLRRRGSAGGHKGVLSVMAALETDNFHRLRLGIGAPPAGVEVVDHVLGNFSAQEQNTVADTLDIAVGAVAVWLGKGIDVAMSRFNGTFIGNGMGDA